MNQKFLASMLATCMAMSMLPGIALAAENDPSAGTPGEVITETKPDTSTDADGNENAGDTETGEDNGSDKDDASEGEDPGNNEEPGETVTPPTTPLRTMTMKKIRELHSRPPRKITRRAISSRYPK